MIYKLLGRTGLRVAEICLGTMTFGEDWGWGASKDESKKIFDAYVKAGGGTSSTLPTTIRTARARNWWGSSSMRTAPASSLPPSTAERLDQASRIELGFPHDFLASPFVRDIVYAGMHGAITNHRS